jgi:hypothetical protein
MAPPPRGPHPRGHERAVGTSERAYRWLLRAYPRGLRDEYGDEMARCFRDLCREELEDGGGFLGLAALWSRTLPELFCTALKERSTMLIRNAYRAAARPALATVFILMLPLLAMQVTDQVVWDLTDFAVAGALLFGTGLTYVLVARKEGNMREASNIAYRFAVGVALAAALILIWMNLAVGLIGSEDNPANLMYGGVLAIGIIGAIVARFRPHGMARALFVTATAQALVPVIALLIWKPQVTSVEALLGMLGVLSVNAFFVMLFVGSALLFRHAARERTPAGAGPEG